MSELFICNECGITIYITTDKCPQCGADLKSEKKRKQYSKYEG